MQIGLPEILYEDNHIIAVNKPHGWLVQGDQTGDKTLADWVKAYIKVKYEKPGDVFLGVIHRLDRPAAGITLFARTSKGLERMNKLFHDRNITKKYEALIPKLVGPESAHLVHWIKKWNEKNTVEVSDVQKDKEFKQAVMDYTLKEASKDQVCLEINLHTGRPHQIRAQLSKMGMPILGDLKYGAMQPWHDGNIALKAVLVEFEHPIQHIPIKISLSKNHWQNK